MAQAVVPTSPLQNPRPAQEIRNFYSPGSVIARNPKSMVVYAKERASGLNVVIKCQRFSPEARAESVMMQTIHHPHAVQFHAAFEDSEEVTQRKFYIAMDNIPEKNLEEVYFNPRTPEKKLTLDEIGCIIRQLLEFLDYLRQHDIVHFDLKLPNLIFRRSSRSLTVIDFGSARGPSIFPSLRGRLTPGFRAPEYLLGKPVDLSYDYWSLGCLIFQLLTGDRLFSFSKTVDESDWDAYHLQLIFNEIGLPDPAYLKACRKAAVFFDDQWQLRKQFDLPERDHWQNRIRETGERNLWPSEEVEGFIEIVGGLLRYENRSLPETLLQHWLFTHEIVVHLEFDRETKCKMYLQRASTVTVALRVLKLADIPNPDLALDFRQTTSTCLHLPRDPEGKYFVVLEKEGYLIKQRFFLDQEALLDIRPLQQEFARAAPLKKRALSTPQNEQGPAKKTKTETVPKI